MTKETVTVEEAQRILRDAVEEHGEANLAAYHSHVGEFTADWMQNIKDMTDDTGKDEQGRVD